MTASPSPAELGRRAGASERTLSRLSGDELGMGYTAWRTQLRLHRRSCSSPRDGPSRRRPRSAGFSSPSAFASAFRAAFGRTPGSLYR